MMVGSVAAPRGAFARALADAESDMTRARRVHSQLPHDGHMVIERPLPHLIFHMRSAHETDTSFERLVKPLPPYLIAGRGSDEAELAEGLTQLVALLADRCGQVLVVELSEEPDSAAISGPRAAPKFELLVARDAGYDDVVTELSRELEQIELGGHRGTVTLERPSFEELPRIARQVLGSPEIAGRCLWVRVGIAPVYRDPTLTHSYPAVLAELQQHLYAALLKALFRFAKRYSKASVSKPTCLGRTTLERAAKEVDGTLYGVSARLAFLLNVAPFNSTSEWLRFRERGFDEEPSFEYRPLMLDPLEQKRMLFSAPFDAIEDPVVARLMREVVEEYDGLLGMLEVRGSEDFLRGSLRVFGAPDDELVRFSHSILERHGPGPPSARAQVDALELVRLARSRLAVYAEREPDFPSAVEMRDDVVAGIMVEKGTLLVHEDLELSPVRAEALLAHEIDTHVLTFHNGTQQALRVLGTGLAGYESTQEGLATLAEYLVGGLTPQRLRVLAGRVLAVRGLCDGASFIDTFRVLHDVHGFAARDAYDTVVRVFRGGGLTKDALYLRGLVEVLHHLRQGGELTPLYAGKFSLAVWNELEALRQRGLVRPPKLTPFWLEREDVERRLERLRAGVSIFDLLSHDESPPDSKREPL
jgi:uncharacterized protein (TIGR02421 family)